MTGELHNAIGDIYLQYLDIPEKVVSNAEFARLEAAYRNYEANNTVANAVAFLDEAGKVQRIASSKGYSVESPYARVNAAIEVGAQVKAGTHGGVDLRRNGYPAVRNDSTEYSSNSPINDGIIRPLDGYIQKLDGKRNNEYNTYQRTNSIIEDYVSLVEKAKSADVSTSTHQAVFYSGAGNRARAESFAKLNGKLTLEMTPGGKYFDDLKLFETDSPLSKEQAREIWKILSERYAKGASGNVYGFVSGASPHSIFNTVEYPALQKNPSVTNMFTELFK